MSTQTIKTRHYAALSSRLRALQGNLSETESQLGLLAVHLQAMAKLGIHNGAQFMAVSRLLDKELEKAGDQQRLEEEEEDAQALNVQQRGGGVGGGGAEQSVRA
ncbi:hypothetical protein BCR39DRAFT_557268 [Naematelia encephala]|uniref:DASH complex subunit Hsk3 like-domain-containing protein n=1 Tax=Naematelia encephala TaxID=71784 RepID=A0A1Y2BF40_9TREE|nr:hypothetical protein BCR39DRAFT_557268 [Naematelia encephala]